MTAELAPIAVLDDDPEVGQVLWKAGGGSGRLHNRYDTFTQLVYLADVANVYQLWLTPRWLLHNGAIPDMAAWNVAPTVRVKTQDERRRVAIVAPSLDRRLEPFAAPATTGAGLLAALVQLEDQLGTWFTATPGRTAEAMIRTDLRRRGRHELVELPELVTRGHLEGPFDWIRPLTPDEASRPYVLALDKHAAYLTAMGHLELGIGEPEHQLRENFPEAQFDRRLPGYWHVRTRNYPLAPSAPISDKRSEQVNLGSPVGLPDPTRASGAPGRREESDGWRWLTTPSVRAANDLGLLLELDQAYVWRQHGRLLAPFAARIRGARDALSAQPDSEAVRIALSALKRLYASLIGRLRMVRESGPDPLFRPDWHDHLVAEARVNLWHNARQLAEPPAACAIDCWYVPSTTAAAPAGLKLGGGAGEYSLKVVPMADLAELFNRGHVRELMNTVTGWNL